MLAWVMNLGFAASDALPPVQTGGGGSAPFEMSMGPELWLSCLLIALIWRLT